MLPTSPSLETAIQKAAKRKEELERWREEKRMKMLQAKLQPPPPQPQPVQARPKPLAGVASRFQLAQPVRAPVVAVPARKPVVSRPPVLAVRSLNHPRPACAVKKPVVETRIPVQEELDIEKQAAFSPQPPSRPASPLPEPVPLLLQTPPKADLPVDGDRLCGNAGLTPRTEDEDSFLPDTPLLPRAQLLDAAPKEEEEVPTPRIRRTPQPPVEDASAGEETYNVSLLLLANDTLVHHLEDCERRRTVECLALKEERDELQYELEAMQQRFNSHIRKMEQSMQSQLQSALDRIEELTQALEDANGGARTPTTKRKRKTTRN